MTFRVRRMGDMRVSWRSSDVWIGGTIVVLGAIVLLIAIPYGVVEPPRLPPKAISPALWPKAISWMLIFFGALVALEGTGKVADHNSESTFVSVSHLPRALFSYFFLFAACVAANWIGLVSASIVLCMGLGLMFGERRYWLLGAISVLVPVALFYFFTQVANVPIPPGSLFE